MRKLPADSELNLVWDEQVPRPPPAAGSDVPSAWTFDKYLAFLEETGSLRNPSFEDDRFSRKFAL